MPRLYYVYILTNASRASLYTGFTGNLMNRVGQHKNGEIDGFTKRYRVDRLVYFEEHTNVWTAIQREKQIKKWRREWKERAINDMNPEWKDLSEEEL